MIFYENVVQEFFWSNDQLNHNFLNWMNNQINSNWLNTSKRVLKTKQESLHNQKNQKSEQETQAIDDRQNHWKYWRDSKNACSRIEFNFEHFVIETRL